jgi:hypothetical protein
MYIDVSLETDQPKTDEKYEGRITIAIPERAVSTTWNFVLMFLHPSNDENFSLLITSRTKHEWISSTSKEELAKRRGIDKVLFALTFQLIMTSAKAARRLFFETAEAAAPEERIDLIGAEATEPSMSIRIDRRFTWFEKDADIFEAIVKELQA